MNLFVFNTNDSEIETFKDLVAFLVVFDLIFVNSTIYFNNQSGLVAVKVHDESLNNLLSPEMKSPKTILPQILPEQFFFFCQLMTQLLCTLHLNVIHLLPNDNILGTHSHTQAPPFPRREGGLGGLGLRNAGTLLCQRAQ